MTKLICDICGEPYEAYGEDPFARDKTDGIAIRVFNKHCGRFEIKHYRTCRACAQMVRKHLDTQSAKTRLAE